MAKNTKFGKIVWAKVKGSSPWPAKGIDPIPGIRRPVKKGNWHFVRFYGTNDHAWVEYDIAIWPYKEFRVRYGEKDKATHLFREGVKHADSEYDELGPEDLPTHDSDDLDAVDNKKEPVKKNKSKTVQKRKSAETKTQPVSKQARSTPAKTNGASSDNTNNIPIKPTYTSPVKLPGRTSHSPRRSADIKAQAVFEFVDETITSQTSSSKKSVKPSSQKIGFIGLGTVGMSMTRNLLKHGHKLCVWNRTTSKCSEMGDIDVQVASTPAEVINECDITLACLADSFAVKEVLFCKYGVLEAMRPGKGFIDLSTVDVETITDAEEQIRRIGGMYLEAPVSGTKAQAAEGSLLFMAAGSKKLYDAASSCFQALGRKSYYLGAAGSGTRMKLALHMISGSITAAVSEGMALADRIGIKQSDLVDAISNSSCGSQLVQDTCQAILDDNFTSRMSLQNIQKDLRLAIDMGDMYDQPLHVAAASNELYKRGKSLGFSEQDMSAVYKAATK